MSNTQHPITIIDYDPKHYRDYRDYRDYRKNLATNLARCETDIYNREGAGKSFFMQVMRLQMVMNPLDALHCRMCITRDNSDLRRLTKEDVKGIASNVDLKVTLAEN